MIIRYLDHAASSWPKPPKVVEAMALSVQEFGANPGRGNHQLSMRASRGILEARTNLARLFHISNPNDIAFTLNATMAINMALMGYLKAGQHVITSSVEHNSVRRPLEYLAKTLGIEITYVTSDAKGKLDLDHYKASFQSNTSLVICSHSSNLLGSILPIQEMAEIAHHKGVLIAVDAAQSAGTYPIDVASMGVDFLAFPGHKGLLGPQGTGGLFITPEIEIQPLLYGGTGSFSEQTEMPLTRPDRYEGGTPNTPGIAGLNEGVKTVLDQTVEAIHEREWNLTQRMISGLLSIPGTFVLGPDYGEDRTGLVSFVLEGMDSAQVAYTLDREYQIAVRAGYHCTSLGHETAGTLASGAVRASVGWNTTDEDVDALIEAVRAMIH